MDFEEQRKQRMSALDEKRKKLDEMRKSRETRVASATATATARAPEEDPSVDRSDSGSSRRSSSAVRFAVEPSKNEPESNAGPSGDAPQRRRSTVNHSMDSLVKSLLVQEVNDSKARDASTSSPSAAKSARPPGAAKTMSEILSSAGTSVSGGKVLKTCKALAIVNVTGSERITYDKSTATDAASMQDEDEWGRESVDGFSDEGGRGGGAKSFRVKAANTADIRARANNRAQSVYGDNKGKANRAQSVMGDVKTRRVRFGGMTGDQGGFGMGLAEMSFSRVLSPEELDEITSTSDFKDFLDNSSLIVERLLSQQDSVAFRSYTGASKTGAALEEHEVLGKPIKYSDKNVAGRPALDLQASPFFSELFVAAYGGVKSQAKYSSAVSDASAGFVCVWSTALSQRPEFRFTASSPVQTAHFHSQNQHLIVGGCYSGQVLLWDMRAKTLPVQRSSMGGLRGHKHPVVSLGMAGSANSHEMVSVSVDGTVCSWDLSRLSEPITTTTLPLPAPAQDAFTYAVNPMDSLRVSSVAFSFEGKREAFRNVIVGSETGKVYHTNLPYRMSDPVTQLVAHGELVTSTNMHPSPLSSYKNLLLTSSLDWGVKLWNLEVSTSPIVEILSPSFDYITDAKWAPFNPAMFAAITSGGELQIWDLAFSTTIPQDSIQVMSDKVDGAKNAPVKEAVNKVVWSKDGKYVMVGDSKGVISVVPIDDRALIPRQGAESRFKDIIGVSVKRGAGEEGAKKEKTSGADEDFIAKIISQRGAAP